MLGCVGPINTLVTEMLLRLRKANYEGTECCGKTILVSTTSAHKFCTLDYPDKETGYGLIRRSEGSGEVGS